MRDHCDSASVVNRGL